MSSYVDELSKDKYVPNVVIQLKGVYFSIRQPDSGLTIDADKVGSVTSINISPTQIDPFRPDSAINNYSFKLLDIRQAVTKLFNADPGYLQRQPVGIWIGRVKAGEQTKPMDFSEYFKLPPVTVQKVTKADSGYAFQAYEVKDRLDVGRFQTKTNLAVDILFDTTVITLTDVSRLPSLGLVQIENEFVSYTGIVGQNLTGCIRGENGSTPIGHDAQTQVNLGSVVQGNPLDLLLKLLISKGGGGVYDVLPDGAGIDESLVDVTQILQVKSEFFSSYVFKLAIFDLESLMDFLNSEILFPLGLRLRSNRNAKIGLAILDRRIFDIDTPEINHDVLSKNPQMNVDDSKIINGLQISWDFDDVTQEFKRIDTFYDDDSITQWGASTVQTQEYKGIKASLNGAQIVNTIKSLFFQRFAYPKPSVQAQVFMSASLPNLGDKVDFVTNRMPNQLGELNFAETLEVIQKAINYETGDVRLQLAFTSFTGIRACYIAPSDTIIAHSGNSVTFGAGRGSYWRKGWVCTLYDNVSRGPALSQTNEIISVIGDVVTFADAWTIPVVDNTHRVMFADYDDVNDQQKKYCFISQNMSPYFADGSDPYKILFGGG